MNTKQLRQKILDLAIKGQLIPQDPNDEPASKLLERIRAEKEQLIKDGKLKRDKNESYIFVSDDKLHYEKFADGSIVCIEDEIPFEIPETWAWERLQNICTLLTDGTHQTPTYTDMGHIFLSSKNVTTNKINWNDVMYIPKDLHEKLYSRLAPELNDILLAKNGTIGKAALVDRDIEFDVYVTLAVIRLFKNHISPQYIHKIIESKYIQDFFKGEQKGIGVPNLHLENIRRTLIPIPPQAEQVRISKTVQELLEIVETLENDKIELSDLIKQTKAKVLDLAIKGKLVPQDPNDESADILLEKIREEKEKLIKEGKLKRDKNETFIFKNSDDNSYYEKMGDETVCIDDDLPFEIPDSWRWTKFGYTCGIARGGSPRPIEKYITQDENGINWIKIGDTEKGGKYICATKEKIKPEGISKSRYVKAGDFLLTNSMSFGRPYILKTNGCIHDGWLVINDNYKVFEQDFLYYLLSSNTMYQLLSIAAKGSTVKNLKSDTVKVVTVPIPPLKEQQRIVKKIESIFIQLDNILSNL